MWMGEGTQSLTKRVAKRKRNCPGEERSETASCIVSSASFRSVENPATGGAGVNGAGDISTRGTVGRAREAMSGLT